MDEAELNGQYIVTLGQVRMRLNIKPGDNSSKLALHNFRPKSIRALLRINDRAAVPIELNQGQTRLGGIDAGDEFALNLRHGFLPKRSPATIGVGWVHIS
jgi:hypothetical protein